MRSLLVLALAAVMLPVAEAKYGSQFLKLGIEGRKTETIPGFVVVKMRPEVARSLRPAARYQHARFKSAIPNSGWTLWEIPANVSYAEASREFQQSPDVVMTQPLNRIYPMLDAPNDPDWGYEETSEDLIFSFGEETPSFPRLWHLDDIQAFNGWSIYPNTWYTAATKPRATPFVAIIDTGCDIDHPDFRNEGGASTAVGDGGQIYKPFSKQFRLGEIQNGGANKTKDTHGHGTHVAGLALAAGNNGGFNGRGTIGTGYMCRGVILRVFDDLGSGTDFDAAAAMYYAADKRIQVINLSLGTENFSQLFQDATTYCFQKGSLVVAAGNEDGSGGGDLGPIYPAACSGALGVTANGPGQIPAVATYSGFGSYADIAAPGGDLVQDTEWFMIEFVYSTSMRTGGSLEDLSNTGALYPPYTRNYSYLAGTSMASPIVAGAAGAYIAMKGWQFGKWRNLQTYKALQRSADAVMGAPYGGWEPYQGYGSLNMASLLSDTPTRSSQVGSVEGIVYNQSTATSNVAVRAQKLVGGVPSGFTYSTTTNQHGYYRYDALPPGDYKVWASPNGNVKERKVTVEVGCDTTGFDFWCGTFTNDSTQPDGNLLVVTVAQPIKLRFSHFCWDTETGIDKIEYRIGTSAGIQDVMADREIIARNAFVDIKNLGLTVGNTYYLRGKYTNGAGLTAFRSVAFTVTP